jgi:DNA-binding MarR family transcriptional regulator
LNKDDFKQATLSGLTPMSKRKPLGPGPLARRTGYLLRRANNTLQELGNGAFAPLGLRPPQFGILLFIGYAPGQKQSDVGEALGFQRSNFVTMVDELEAEGLARRNTARDDARVYTLHLTAQGRRRLARAIKVDDRIEAGIRKKLGAAGRRQLQKYLRKLAEPD